MRFRHQGFTIVELIVVILVLGILSAVALPKFIDISGDAKTAATKGVAGGAAAAMTLNFAGCVANGHTALAGKCVKIRNCNEIGTIMQGGFPSADYSIGNVALAAVGTEDTCTVTNVSDNSKTATFTGIGAGN